MKKFVLKSKPEPLDPEYGIPVEMEQMIIRITDAGWPENGHLHYEGTIRKFVLERLPRPELTAMLPRLLQASSFPYCLHTETLVVARVDTTQP